MNLLHSFFLVILGLAGGFAVGSGFVAFITVLSILPRLVQMTQSQSCLRLYEWAIILGVLCFTWLDFFHWVIYGPKWTQLILGLLMGLFIGMLAAALTEVVNVIPILSRRLKMYEYLFFLLMAMAIGKTFGSLFQWIFY